MFLVVGLGNPGTRYANNRHNIGFMAAAEIAAAFSFSSPQKKFDGQIQSGDIDGERAIILMPETYMNLSGKSVQFDIKPAVGAPESAVAVDQMIELRNRGFKPKTIGGDKGYHTEEFVAGARENGIVPHPALKDGQKTLHV
ncbi:MAG TPA: aminoacyl-tRNA hydrolase, partial [Alphaproteobacteria bacterium]|nr:aminoacyl-tRNA hydrolase [Alphaproteobacteria bacterium]